MGAGYERKLRERQDARIRRLTQHTASTKSTSVAPQEHRALTLHAVKAIDGAPGRFSGYLSVFGNADAYTDIVDQGAFKYTLAEARARRQRGQAAYLWPLLWQHDRHEPIGGIVDASEDARGLTIVGQLDLDVEPGRRAYSGLLKGYLHDLSIGYDTVTERYDAQGYRHLTEIRLWEGSVVTFAANPEAQVTDVKAQPRPRPTTPSPSRDWVRADMLGVGAYAKGTTIPRQGTDDGSAGSVGGYAAGGYGVDSFTTVRAADAALEREAQAYLAMHERACAEVRKQRWAREFAENADAAGVVLAARRSRQTGGGW